MAAPGTLKKGGPSSANVRTVLTFTRPAGKILTLRTQKDPSWDAEVSEKEGVGTGSVAPYAILRGEGKASYKTQIAAHEFDLMVAIAKEANCPIMGDGGLVFDITQTTTIDGLPKSTTEVIGGGVGKGSGKISGDGNMVDLEGLCLNIIKNGVPMLREAT